jgi:hypothetical protein
MERFPLELLARITCMDADKNELSRECKTSNICAGGVYFSIENPFPVSTDVQVSLYWNPEMFIAGSSTEKNQIKLTGSVVRAEKRGMAISFKNNFRFVTVN